MSIQIYEVKEDEHSMKPYKFFFEIGDCADTLYARNVPKEKFAENFAFRVAGFLKVKHAP